MTVRKTFAALLCVVLTLPFASAALAADATAKADTPQKKLTPYTYDYARHETVETGKPLLVFIGAEWCGACVQMKNNVIPDLKKSKLLNKVSFAMVDFDENRNLSKKLTSGGPIPQTILYCKDKKGWHSHKLIGGQSLASVESLIKESLAQAPKASAEAVAGQNVQTR